MLTNCHHRREHPHVDGEATEAPTEESQEAHPSLASALDSARRPDRHFKGIGQGIGEAGIGEAGDSEGILERTATLERTMLESISRRIFSI